MMSSLVNPRSAPVARQCPILRPVDGSAIQSPIAVNRPVCVIGDRSRVHLVLPSPLVSRSHALLVDDADGLYVRDLSSSNGVIVNDSRVRETLLHDGDKLKIGPFVFRCRVPAAQPNDDHDPVEAIVRDEAGRTVRLNDRRSTLIGSRGGCDVRVDGIGVSSVHAVIFRRRGRWFIRDLSSEGGTRIFGRLIREAELLGGEQIRIGTAAIWYIRPDQERPQVAERDTATVTPDVLSLPDDVPTMEIGPEESGLVPLPATGEAWTRSEGFEAQQVTADDLGLDALENAEPTALASASNLKMPDPENTLVDASRSVLTLADLIDAPMTAADLDLTDEAADADAVPIVRTDPTSQQPPAEAGASSALPVTPDRPSKPRGRPAPIDAKSVFDHDLYNPEESGSLPEFSDLLGIDSALADLGLGDATPEPAAVPDPLGLRQLSFAPLVAGWARCPGCGTAFPLAK